MKKQVLLLIMMTMLPMMANAYDACIDGVYYDFNNETKTAAVTYKSYDDFFDEYNHGWNITTANIPASVEYNDVTYSVTSIGEYAFCNCSGLTSVTIGNDVTSIEQSAFSGCKSLTSMTLPNSVTSIGENAFCGCGFTSVTLPNSVTSIEKNAFVYCNKLTSVTIPNSVTSIGINAFAYCTSLTSIEIPNSVTTIGERAFECCVFRDLKTTINNEKHIELNHCISTTFRI